MPAACRRSRERAMSSHKKDKGRIEGPFVPMLIQTTSSPAWRAMSPYAREVYRVLKSRYGFDARNNGRIYVSDRDGAEETGFNKDTVGRALRELQHYGFIVMTEPGCLGVNGKGKAPHWRLTELGYMREPPTRDFLKWNGELFHEQKNPKYYLRKKQNPVRPNRTGCPATPDIPVSGQTRQLPEKVSGRVGHINQPACPVPSDISRVNHSPPLKWSTPTSDGATFKGDGRARVHCRQPETPAHPLHRGCMDAPEPNGGNSR
jgi:hypothetical protein